MNWKVFLRFFALPLCSVFAIDCFKVGDIVNGLNVLQNILKLKIPGITGEKVKSLEAFLRWAISWK